MTRRVLLVDDDEMLLRCTTRYLGRRYQFDVATSGHEALELINTLYERTGEASYAVIISDLSMPRMNGKVLLRKAKKLSPRSSFFLLTGNQDYETDVQAMSNLDGLIEEFIRKPCDPHALSKTIASGIEKFGRRNSAEASVI